MALTGEQYAELTSIIVEAFDWASLNHLVRIKFNIELANEVGASNTLFKAIADGWVKWLEMNGRTADFVGYMWAERKAVARVDQFYKAFTNAAKSDPGADTNTAFGPARDKVIEFKVYFNETSGQIVYLNAFKDLHDVLHYVQGVREGIVQAVARIREQPSAKKDIGFIAEDLQELVVRGRKAARQLEDESDAEWLDAFADAVTALAQATAGPDPAKLETASNAILEFPPLYQAGLNAELVKTAKRLKAARLGKTANEVLARFATAPPLLAEFRARLGAFGGLCDQLTKQIALHDICQAVDLILSANESVPNVSASNLPGWPGVAERLKQLGIDRPDDSDARRCAATALSFTDARGSSAVDLFSNLLIYFRRMFDKADKELLAATDDILSEAKLLNLQLRALTNVPE